MNNEPVAWMELYYGEPNNIAWTNTELKDSGEVYKTIPLYTHPAKTLTNEDAKQKLIRIMETFDLATGHADTFDELLDSLKVELRDVLGYYREALRNAQKK